MGIVCSTLASVCTFIGKGIELGVTAIAQLVDLVIGAVFGLLSGICMCLAGWACCCRPQPAKTTAVEITDASVPKVSYTEKYRTNVAALFARKPSEPKAKVEEKKEKVEGEKKGLFKKKPAPAVETKDEAEAAAKTEEKVTTPESGKRGFSFWKKSPVITPTTEAKAEENAAEAAAPTAPAAEKSAETTEEAKVEPAAGKKWFWQK